MKKGIVFLFALGMMVSCSKNNKDLVVGEWKVSGLQMAGTSVDPELVGPFIYTVKDDGSYIYQEAAVMEKGTWSVSDDNKKLIFTSAEGKVTEKNITSANADSIVLDYTSNTMPIVHVLKAKK